MYNTYDLITSLKNEHIVESKKIFNSLILKRCNELIEQRKEELKNEIFNEEKDVDKSANRAAMGNAMAAVAANKKKKDKKPKDSEDIKKKNE